MNCNIKRLGFILQPGVDPATGNLILMLSVSCMDCGRMFQFLGMEPGYNPNGTGTNAEATVALLTLSPPTDVAVAPGVTAGLNAKDIN